MSAQDWAAFILTLLSISGIVLSGIRWYIKVQIKPLQEAVEDIRKETKTNGGSSMRDEIKTIKAQQEEAKKLRKATSDKVDHLYDLFVEYVSRPR
jgi:hypothetical protein